MRIASSLLAFCFIGCTATLTELPPPAIPAATSFTFTDARAQELKLSRPSTMSNTDLMLGDDALLPSAPEVLRATLQAELAALLTGKTVTLSFAEVSVSDPGARLDIDRLKLSTPPGSNPIASPFAGVVILAIERSRSTKSVYVRLEGTVSGKPFAAKLSEPYAGRIGAAHIQSTLQSAARLAAFQIERIEREGR